MNNILLDTIKETLNDVHIETGTQDEFNSVCQKLEAAVSVKTMKWINVENELPPEDIEDCVDIYSETMGRMIDCSYNYDDECWLNYNDDDIEHVTHWMPQPESPIY